MNPDANRPVGRSRDDATEPALHCQGQKPRGFGGKRTQRQ